MKTIHKWILAILILACLISAFSFVSSIEDGMNENWLILFVLANGGACYGLCKHWEKRGELPEDMTDEKNDRA